MAGQRPKRTTRGMILPTMCEMDLSNPPTLGFRGQLWQRRSTINLFLNHGANPSQVFNGAWLLTQILLVKVLQLLVKSISWSICTQSDLQAEIARIHAIVRPISNNKCGDNWSRLKSEFLILKHRFTVLWTTLPANPRPLACFPDLILHCTREGVGKLALDAERLLGYQLIGL